MGGKQRWEECVITKADFGARGAQSLANAGADKIIADHITPSNPKLGAECTYKRYADDVMVMSPKDEPIEEKLEIASNGLEKGGLVIKEWIISGKGNNASSIEIGKGNDANAIKEGEKCLGFLWQNKQDRFAPRVSLNYSKRVRGRRIHEDLKPGGVAAYVETHGLTKRNALCIQMSVFDITGLIVALVMRVRLAYRKLLLMQNGIAWDEPLNETNKKEWIALA